MAREAKKGKSLTAPRKPKAAAPALMHVNAHRTVVCVDACAGIPTEALESGVIAEMREAVAHMLRRLRDRPEAERDDRDTYAIECAEAVLAKINPTPT